MRRTTTDRRFQSLEEQRFFLMNERERLGADPRARDAFDQFARRFNDKAKRQKRTDLVVPLFSHR
jgi:hypothetical protein